MPSVPFHSISCLSKRFIARQHYSTRNLHNWAAWLPDFILSRMSQKERQQNIANIPGKVDELDGESGDSARKDDIVSVTQSIEKLSLSGDKAGCATQSDDPTKLSKANPVLQALASWIQDGNCQRILVLTGAGVSVAAGIPDFRTPGTGLYDNLQKYNLPYPEAVFDLNFYRTNPEPFCSLAKEMWPGLKHTPTLTHSFISLLAEKELLVRNYTQNIDGLEFLANTPDELLVECHGHYRTATCIQCGETADSQLVKQAIVEQGTAPKCGKCNGLVKPDIVFFGESLPKRFFSLLQHDTSEADLILVLGTSLQVAPVSMIPDMVHRTCKRVLLNRDLVGSFWRTCKEHSTGLDGYTWEHYNSKRDLFISGDCDDSVVALAKLLGWETELREKHAQIVDAIRKVHD